MLMRFYKIFSLIMLILVFLFITSSSLIPAKTSSVESSGFAVKLISISAKFNVTLTITQSQNIVRKCMHFLEFAALTFFATNTFFAFFQKRVKYIVHVLFIGLATAVIDESIQLFIEGRGPLVTDILLDFSGAIAGFLFAILTISIFTKNERFKSIRYF